jgi:hypothetical protein
LLPTADGRIMVPPWLKRGRETAYGDTYRPGMRGSLELIPTGLAVSGVRLAHTSLVWWRCWEQRESQDDDDSANREPATLQTIVLRAAPSDPTKVSAGAVISFMDRLIALPTKGSCIVPHRR